MREIFLIILFIIFCFKICFSQSVFLDKGQNATFFQGCIEKYKYSFSQSTTIGYSINGKFDMMLSGKHLAGDGIGEYFTISPSFSYLVIKQDRLPVSLGLLAGYEFKKFTQTDLIKDHSIKAVASVFHKWKVSDKVSLIPGAYCESDFIKRSLDVYKENLNLYTIGFQTSLLLKKISITPETSYSKDRFIFSIKFGVFILGTNYIESIN